MPAVSSKVSQQELDAIMELANRQGVTISNLVRTILIQETTGQKSVKAKDVVSVGNQDPMSGIPNDENNHAIENGSNSSKGMSRLSEMLQLKRSATAEEIRKISQAQKARDECLVLVNRICAASQRKRRPWLWEKGVEERIQVIS